MIPPPLPFAPACSRQMCKEMAKDAKISENRLSIRALLHHQQGGIIERGYSNRKNGLIGAEGFREDIVKKIIEI
jgi:hypothetical protein